MQTSTISPSFVVTLLIAGFASEPQTGSKSRIEVGSAEDLSGPAVFGGGAIEGRILDDQVYPVAVANVTVVDSR